VALVNAGKIHMIEERRVRPFVPDLTIEVVSENDKFEEVMERLIPGFSIRLGELFDSV
jgi:hypothetical protein